MPNAAAHLSHLQALLPQGPAWPRDTDAALTQLLAGLAAELARFDDKADQILLEADVRSSVDMLPEWEYVLGLPDRCAAAAAVSIGGRQTQALRKLAYQAGHSRAFYYALASAMGYSITIIEFDNAVDRFDPDLTALITSGRWRFVWRVNVSAVGAGFFRAGRSVAGDRLRTGSAHDLECVFEAAKQSHTHIVFTYEEA